MKLILLSIFLTTLIAFTSHAKTNFTEKQSLPRIEDTETIEYLYDKALSLSGLNGISLETLPNIYMVSKSQLNHIVCPEDPENCRNLAAVFDDIEYRILVLDDFDISENFKPYDYSFVIHELIHALQYRQYGAEIFNGCKGVFETEKLAYQAQDRYLKKEGAFQRVGHFLRFFYCDEEIAQADYVKSKAVWDARQSDSSWPPKNGLF